MPALPGPIARLNFGGAMPGADEWSCSIMFAGIIAEPALLTSANGFKAPLSDWFGRATSMIAKNTTLEYVKFNLINKSDGHYTNQAETIESLFTPLVAGGTTTVSSPNQCTSAITLHSDLARGRASKGRFYPPTGFYAATSNKMENDGRLIALNAKGMADSAQELVSELNAAASSFNACIWSQAAQVAEAVEQVSVGRVIDTQRRRRSSLDEDRQFATANV